MKFAGTRTRFGARSSKVFQQVRKFTFILRLSQTKFIFCRARDLEIGLPDLDCPDCILLREEYDRRWQVYAADMESYIVSRLTATKAQSAALKAAAENSRMLSEYARIDMLAHRDGHKRKLKPSSHRPDGSLNGEPVPSRENK